jgi:pimeloyl-ACP methyl ester carboxylesterase
MKRACVALILCVLCALCVAEGQQVPFLCELFSRYEEFNRLFTAKRNSGANTEAIEPLRKRGEEAFRRGNIPGIIELIGQSTAVLQGKPWDDKQKFTASLALETDRIVIEPNAELHVSLTRIFQTNIDQAYTSSPTVTFEVAVAPQASATVAQRPVQPLVIAQRLPIGITSSNAARRLFLADGAYSVVARVESGGQTIAELKRPLYAISNFSDSVAQMSKLIAAIKASSDPKVQPLAPLIATPEFQLQRLAPLNKSRSETEINPAQELDRIEAALSAISKGQNPFSNERGELERAYRASDGKLVPYRLYIPKNYDGAMKPLVVMLHGTLGDEAYYFSGLFDPAVIKGEAERRSWILAGVNGRGRFSGYTGPAVDDSFEVVKCVTRDYRIDASRIYLTGHSMGGFGTWLIASTKPELFAAIAPVSGGAPMKGEALGALLERTKSLPTMVVHGGRDSIAPPQLSRDMVAAAQKAGLKVNYLEVPDADHMTVLSATFPSILDFFEKNTKAK